MNIIEIKLPNGRLKFAIVEKGYVYDRELTNIRFENGIKKSDYKKGAEIRCSCKYDGETPETATQFKYKNDKMICPDCDKEIKVLKTVKDIKKEEKENIERAYENKIKAQKNIHLIYETQSISSGLQYYRLSTRIEYEDWKKISHLFRFHDSERDFDDDEQDTWGDGLNGWLTTSPEKVEEILNVKPKNRLAYRNKKAQDKKDKKQKIKEELDSIKTKVNEAFKTAESPWKYDKKYQNKGMLNYPHGEELERPNYPFDIRGGGQLWILNKEEGYIWEIHNNGHDVDDWSRNNICTGGAGAIGHRVKYTDALEKNIRKIIELENRLRMEKYED